MLTDLTLHMMIPTYHMAKSSGCVSNELVWIVALASSSTIRNKSLFYQKIELTLTVTTPERRVQVVRLRALSASLTLSPTFFKLN